MGFTLMAVSLAETLRAGEPLFSLVLSHFLLSGSNEGHVSRNRMLALIPVIVGTVSSNPLSLSLSLSLSPSNPYPYPYIPVPIPTSIPMPIPIPISLSLSLYPYPYPYIPIPIRLSLYPFPYIPIPILVCNCHGIESVCPKAP